MSRPYRFKNGNSAQQRLLTRRKPSLKECERMISLHSQRVKTWQFKLKQCNEAYDLNFEHIRKSIKKSPEHYLLLFIENTLDGQAAIIKTRIEEERGHVLRYQTQKIKVMKHSPKGVMSHDTIS